MTQLLADLERVSRLTKNGELRDRILRLVLDGRVQVAEPVVETEAAVQTERVVQAERVVQPEPAVLVSVKELAAAMLAVVDMPYLPKGPVSTRGMISRRFGAAFRGPKYSKDGLQAVDVSAVADAFDALVCVMQNIAEIGPSRLRRIGEKKIEVVGQFA
jgi:hypothetical protein